MTMCWDILEYIHIMRSILVIKEAKIHMNSTKINEKLTSQNFNPKNPSKHLHIWSMVMRIVRSL